MIENNTEIAIALSGGKDSLTLLFLLKEISGRGFPDFNIHAIFIAGKNTCGASINENYLKAICQHLNINLIIKEIDTQPTNCYSCSRKRRKIIFEESKKLGINTIAFGHHRDDNIQTLLMNLLHKGEFSGNLPKIYMQKYDITIIRPLILIPENEIIKFAQHYNFKRITCQCPLGQKSMRQQVNSLISEIEELYPNARKNLSRASLKYGSNKANYPCN